MDVRDIKVIPSPKNTNVFRDILELQKDLLDGYIKIEGLPQYPIDIDSKKGQILLKDFIGRVTEELGESYETMVPYINGELGKNDYNRENSLEELADALHFMLEVVIYVGVEDELISEMENPYSPHVMGMRGGLTIDDKYSGRITGPELIDFIKESLWEQTFSLQMARNTLKNKPWKQTGIMTDIVVTKGYVIKAFFQLIGVFMMFGLDYMDIYEYYYRKNRVNKFRQESKY